MTAERGFRKAKSLLQEHFGNEHRIATAYMEKALSWSSIKPDDTKALQAYTLFLRGCCNAMEDVNNMQELNMSANLLIIIKKLPYRLRDKWRSVACDFQERYKQRATFRDLVNYLEKQARIATDPVFGDIRDTPTPGKDGRSFMSKPQHPRIKGSTFATTVTVAHEKHGHGARKMDSWPAVKRCSFCGGGHALEVCFLLEKKAHHEKITFLKENEIGRASCRERV